MTLPVWRFPPTTLSWNAGPGWLAAFGSCMTDEKEISFKALSLQRRADVPVSAPQTHVAQLEATIKSAHALLQAGLIKEATNLLAAFSTEVQPRISSKASFETQVNGSAGRNWTDPVTVCSMNHRRIG